MARKGGWTTYMTPRELKEFTAIDADEKRKKYIAKGKAMEKAFIERGRAQDMKFGELSDKKDIRYLKKKLAKNPVAAETFEPRYPWGQSGFDRGREYGVQRERRRELSTSASSRGRISGSKDLKARGRTFLRRL